MTRSERIMHLIQLLKGKRRVSIQQLSEACGVSHRTIYRDIATLSKMKVPVYFDNGYRLSRRTGYPLADLGAEDIELLCYCLQNNPLAAHPFFSTRFQAIETRMLEQLKQKTGNDGQSLFLIGPQPENVDRTPETDLLERFLRAIIEGCKVELVAQDRSHLTGLWVPLAVRTLRGDSLVVVARSVSDEPEEINISGLREIRLVDIHFDRLQADHLRRNIVQQKKELTSIDA